MKIWIDDIRKAPPGYVWCRSVNEAKYVISHAKDIEIIDMDHDAGDYAKDGGDYIKVLDWLVETDQRYPIKIHSMNPVGVDNMRRLLHRYGFTEVVI